MSVDPQDLINLARQNALLKGNLAEIAKIEEAIKKASDAQRDILNSLVEEYELRKDELEFSERFYNDLVNSYKIDQKRQEGRRQDILVQQQILQIRLKTNEITNDEYETQVKLLLLQERSLNAYDTAKAKTEQLADILGIERAEDTTLFKMISDPKEAFGGMISGLEKTLNPLNLLNSSMEKLLEVSIGQADAFAHVQKQTGIVFGTFDKLNYSMSAANNITRLSGISTEETAKATNELIDSFNEFTNLNAGAQEELIATVSVLELYGISAQFSAKNINILSKAFGLSAVEASKFNTRFASLATSLKMPMNQLTQGFEAANNNLLAMSKSDDEVAEGFERLASVSKKVGMEISRIVSITDKFDTFDSAAQSVGKLNALLGGPYLNTLEMVSSTDPTERFTKLKEAVDMAGLSFDQMSYYEKKALQQSLGLESMAELASFMAGDINSLAPSEASMSEQSLLELQANTVAFRGMLEEIKTIGIRLAIGFGPVVTVMKLFLDIVGYLAVPLSYLAAGIVLVNAVGGTLWMLTELLNMGFMGIMANIYGGLLTGFGRLSSAITFLTPGLSSLNAALVANRAAFIGTLFFFAVALGAALYYLGANIGLVVAGVAGLTIGIYAMSAAEKTSVILLGLFLVAAGIAAIAHALAVGNSPSLIEAFLMSAVAIGVFAMASNFMLPFLIAVVPAIAALAFSAVMLGAGFALAGFGFQMAGQGAILLSEGLASIAKTVAEGGMTLALNIYSIASSMTALGASAMLSAMPLGLAALAMMGFGAAATFAMTPIMGIALAVTMIIESMSTLIELISTNLATAFIGIGEGLSVIVQQMQNLPIPETLALTALVVAATPMAAILGPALVTTSAVTGLISPSNNTQTQRPENTGGAEVGNPAEITFNLNLSIDGEQFNRIVNKVKVDPMQDKALYSSIRKMITSGMESA